MNKQSTQNQTITGTAVFAGMADGPVRVMPAGRNALPRFEGIAQKSSVNQSADLEMDRYDLASERVETDMIALSQTIESQIAAVGSEMLGMHQIGRAHV